MTGGYSATRCSSRATVSCGMDLVERLVSGGLRFLSHELTHSSLFGRPAFAYVACTTRLDNNPLRTHWMRHLIWNVERAMEIPKNWSLCTVIQCWLKGTTRSSSLSRIRVLLQPHKEGHSEARPQLVSAGALIQTNWTRKTLFGLTNMFTWSINLREILWLQEVP